MIDITDQIFDAEVLQSDIPVLVDFWASWCSPCRMLAPTLEELNIDYQDKIKLVKLDVDANPATAQKYNILSIPTVILFHKGQPITQMVGVQPKEKFTVEINKLLGN